MPAGKRPTNARDNRLLNTIEMRERRKVMTSYPYSIQLEVTTKCNFACIMCARDKYHGIGENLTNDILDIVVQDIFPSCQDIIVSSFGEPLLYPRMKDIFQKIDPESGLELGFFTNFVLMTEDMAETIVKSGVGYVNASIDGATKQSYEKIRRGGKWEILCEKLEMFRQVRQRLGSKTPLLNLCVVGSTLNVDEIPTFVEFGHKYGFDSVKYNHNMYVDDEKMDYMSLVHQKEHTVRMYMKGFRRALELGMRTNFNKLPFRVEPELRERLEREIAAEGSSPEAREEEKGNYFKNKMRLMYNERLGWRVENTWNHAGGSPENFRKLFFTKARDYMRDRVPLLNAVTKRPPYPHPIPNDAPPRTCGNPWTHVHIKSDGLVYPCCFSDEVMGDLRKESFEGIWNGEKYQDLRESLRTGEYWETCRRSSCNWVEGSNSNVYESEIDVLNPITELDGSKGTTLKVRVRNKGLFRWEPPSKNAVSPVSLSYRMFNKKLELIDEGLHVAVDREMNPGDVVELDLPIKPVRYAGEVTIKVDMVHERITWFGERGNNAYEMPVRVHNVPFAAYISTWKSSELKKTLDEAALIAGSRISIPIRVTNVGTGPIGGPEFEDAASYHIRGEDKLNYDEWEGIATPFPKVIEPGESAELQMNVEIPRILEVGRYWLEIDVKRDSHCLSLEWHRPLLSYPIRVVAEPADAERIPAKRPNGKPYLWEPRGQCVSNTGNKGIW